MNKKILKNSIVSAFLAMSVTGCSTIVSDSTYPVSIQSSPANSEFVIKDQDGIVIHQGKTPTSVTLESSHGYFQKAKYTITFKKEGFKDTSHTLVAGLDGWYIGNILFGGLIGLLIVDPATGAMWKLPEETSANLAQLNKKDIDTKLTVMTVDELPENLQQQLIAL